MPRGSNPKREREYRALEQKFEKSGRYRGREKEVAARIVNKQRAMYGETRQAKQQERAHTEPDKNLPIPRYRHLTIPQIERELRGLSRQQMARIERYERAHKGRKGVIERIERARSG